MAATLRGMAGVLANADMTFWRYGTRTGNAPYLDRVRERPYQYHTWVYACARSIAMNISRLPQRMVEPDHGSNFLKTHEILDLLAQPNPYMTGTTFRQAVVLSLLLSSAPNRDANWTNTMGGQCFIVCWDDKKGRPANVAKGEMPTQLYPFSDAYFTPRPGPRGAGGMSLAGWRYHVPADPDSDLDFDVGEVIRIYNYNPYDQLAGLAPYMPAQVAVDQDSKADVYNTKMFDNDGRPTGLLSSDAANIPPDRQKLLLKEWNEAYGGIGNVGKTALLSNGLKYQQLGLAHVDMQYLEQRGFNKEQIMSSFGVNIIALGQIEKLNYNIVKEGKKISWYDTFMPWDELIAESINVQFVKIRTGKKYIVTSDYSGVEALREDFKTRAETAGILCEKVGFPPTLASQITKIPLTEEQVKKYPWLDERLISITARLSPQEDISQAQEQADKGEQPAQEAVARKSIAGAKGSEERKAFSRAYGDHLDRSALDFAGDMRKFFYRQRNEMQDKVDGWLKSEKAAEFGYVIKNIVECPTCKGEGHTTILKTPTACLYPCVKCNATGRLVRKPTAKADTNDDSGFDPLDPNLITPEIFTLDEVAETEKLLALYKPYIKVQSEKEVAQIEKELNETIDWSLHNDELDKWAAKREEDLAGINGTTFDAVKDKVSETINQGIKDGVTPQEMAKNIKDVLRTSMATRVNQAGTIARTEMGIISSMTRYDAFKAEGIEEWEWVTAHDEFVRESHQELDGVVVKVGEEYPGVDMKCARDPAGDISEIINCRCVNIKALV